MRNSSKMPRLASVSAVLVITVFVSSCTQSIDRRDSISSSFGNAMATNTALQTVDPWPRQVENTHIHTDGAVTGNAIKTYRKLSSGGGKATTIEESDIAPSN